MNPKETLEEIEEIITELQEENKTVPILVEGEKDAIALRLLGMTGEIIQFNRGLSIPDFCEIIAQNYKKCILLTDWDKKGGRLCLLIKKQLENRMQCNLRYRERIAKRSVVRTVEGLPSWIATLRTKVYGE